MNDRFKFRVWDKYAHETPAEQIQFLCFNGCLVDSDGCHHSPDDYIFEQCTGLRDINGNLIYAGDRGILTVFGGIGPNGGYVDSDKQVNARVEWVDECAGFYFVDDNGIYYDMTNSTESFEIVGNIHEQKEQQ